MFDTVVRSIFDRFPEPLNLENVDFTYDNVHEITVSRKWSNNDDCWSKKRPEIDQKWNKKVVKNAICMLRSTTLAMFTSLMHDASECMRPPPPGRSVDEATCNEIFDSDTFLHRKFLTGTRMKIVNADFIQPGPIGISVVKSPTGYGVVGGGGAAPPASIATSMSNPSI